MSAPRERPLSQLTLEELWQLFPIQLSPHREEWDDWYMREAARLQALAAPGQIARLSHIGSTAVPGLVAKPIVDLLLEATGRADAAALEAALLADGWLCMSRQETPFWGRSFNKGYTPQGFARQVFHLHLRCLGDWDELYFRDYLRAHRETAQEYAALKRALAGPYRHDRDGYTRQKGDFVRRVTALARAEFPGRYAGDAASQAAADGRK